MRIISGEHRGRVLKAAQNLPTRPTTDFAKTGLFNILNNQLNFEQITVLDLFAGIGGISLELLSRGAKRIVSVEKEPKCAAFIAQVAKDWNRPQLTVAKGDAFNFVKNSFETFDLIFMDPPYDLKEALDLPTQILEKGMLKPGGILVQEHQSKEKIVANTYLYDQRSYGNVGFSFYKLT